MNNQRKYKILLTELSSIVSVGLKSLIESNPQLSVTVHNPTSGHHSEGGQKRYDLVIVNPSIAGYSDRVNMRSYLRIDSQTPMVALLYGTYDESSVRQFDNIINLLNTPDQIQKKLLRTLKNKKEGESCHSNELSTRERDILTAVAQGKTNKEIADQFHLSIYTVVTHRKNISHKLGINSISGLTVYAIINKLIDVADF